MDCLIKKLWRHHMILTRIYTFFFSHDVMLHLSHTFCSQECIPSSALSNI